MDTLLVIAFLIFFYAQYRFEIDRIMSAFAAWLESKVKK